MTEPNKLLLDRFQELIDECDKQPLEYWRHATDLLREVHALLTKRLGP
jgi:hypothetical protein